MQVSSLSHLHIYSYINFMPLLPKNLSVEATEWYACHMTAAGNPYCMSHSSFSPHFLTAFTWLYRIKVENAKNSPKNYLKKGPKKLQTPNLNMCASDKKVQ